MMIIGIPIVGRVAAGQPILAEQNIEGNLLLDASMVKTKTACFGLKVRGDSMINAGIFEGDLVIVSPQQNAVNGDIIVALLHYEATMKRFIVNENIIYLKPENERYQPIEVNQREDFSIIGSHCLKKTISIEKPPVQDRNLGALFLNYAPIKIYKHRLFLFLFLWP